MCTTGSEEPWTSAAAVSEQLADMKRQVLLQLMPDLIRLGSPLRGTDPRPEGGTELLRRLQDDRGTPTKAGRAMLSLEAEAPTANPDGSGTPKMPVDGHAWRYRAGTTSHWGRFRPGTSLLRLFGDRRQGYSAPESAPAGLLSEKCRFNRGSGPHAQVDCCCICLGLPIIGAGPATRTASANGHPAPRR